MVSNPLPPVLPRWDCIWICNGSKTIICMCLRLSSLSKCAGVPPEWERDRECVGLFKANTYIWYLVSVWDTVFIDIMHINWIICTAQLDWLVSARVSRIYFHLTQVQIQCAGTVRRRQTDSTAGRQLHSLMCILIWYEAIGIIFTELVLRVLVIVVLTVETVSELIYTPKGERDYGTLACWGRNAIGKQSEPCLFQVVPAGESRSRSSILIKFPFVMTIITFHIRIHVFYCIYIYI